MRILRLRYSVLACIALSAVITTWSLWHERTAARAIDHVSASSTEAAADNERGAPLVVISQGQTPGSPSTESKKEETLAYESQPQDPPAIESDPLNPSSALGRELLTADKRTEMASAWGLTEQETEAFHLASAAPSQERMEVMMRFAKGEFAEADLAAELQSADERGLQQVHDVLGDEHFNEYLSLRWHFETDEPDLSPSS